MKNNMKKTKLGIGVMVFVLSATLAEACITAGLYTCHYAGGGSEYVIVNGSRVLCDYQETAAYLPACVDSPGQPGAGGCLHAFSCNGCHWTRTYSNCTGGVTVAPIDIITGPGCDNPNSIPCES